MDLTMKSNDIGDETIIIQEAVGPNIKMLVKHVHGYEALRYNEFCGVDPVESFLSTNIESARYEYERMQL